MSEQSDSTDSEGSGSEEFSELMPQYVRVIDPNEGVHVAVSEEGMVLIIVGTPPLHETYVIHPFVGSQLGPAVTLASFKGQEILEAREQGGGTEPTPT